MRIALHYIYSPVKNKTFHLILVSRLKALRLPVSSWPHYNCFVPVTFLASPRLVLVLLSSFSHLVFVLFCLIFVLFASCSHLVLILFLSSSSLVLVFFSSCTHLVLVLSSSCLLLVSFSFHFLFCLVLVSRLNTRESQSHSFSRSWAFTLFFAMVE